MADVYENDIDRVKPHMKASLTLDALAGRTFEGMVGFVDPLLDPATRTLKAHLHFENPKRELRPGMFGEVTLQGARTSGVLIPADAVIHAGTHDVVFVAGEGGAFTPRTVEVGARSGDDVEVRSGIAAGEAVVIRANFLIDSESRLRSALKAAEGKR
jgi:Cu(I)/Ag(I) efflux system membrane fusion protein